MKLADLKEPFCAALTRMLERPNSLQPWVRVEVSGSRVFVQFAGSLEQSSVRFECWPERVFTDHVKGGVLEHACDFACRMLSELSDCELTIVENPPSTVAN